VKAWRPIALFLLLFSTLLQPASAQSGLIAGQVANGTQSPAAPLANQPVTLYIYQGEAPTGQSQALTDAQGRFSFGGLALGEQARYLLATNYAEVDYISDWLALSTAAPSLEQSLIVYESTSDDSEIAIQPHHIVLAFDQGDIVAQELVFVENRGLRTFVGAGERITSERVATLRFSLPLEATDLSFADPVTQQNIMRTPDGFVDTRPVPPGRWEYVYSYHLAANGRYTLRKNLYYPTDRLHLLVADVGAQVAAAQLEAQGQRAMQGASYLYWTQEGLARGTELLIELDKLPTASSQPAPVQAPAQPNALLGWVGLAAIALAVFASLVRPFWNAKAPREGQDA